ncbi:uncharacterized protein MKK02DRAFT_39826 [Dioszegia hungarica]|uniref:Uncharacterized protein n=1 Tax=Dioszegia hungarica TaxID=4972 RepID=A0AA38HFW0_9TREE|nr:uncharacterized protein MKK02DRAFT_39826 [Dioszegia hungarica]KAI9639517.1 hypothetical protein MKK02DRAFT_39826 [Dioszegia hungarica]
MSVARIPSLDEDALSAVMACADEVSLWRARAVSRDMKRIADEKLKPFLATKRVVSRTAKEIDVYDYDQSGWQGKQDDRYRRELKAIHARFSRHLLAYPLSSSELQRLSLEMRDDTTSGWSLLKELGTQLKSLQLVVHDSMEYFVWKDYLREDSYWEEDSGSERSGVPLEEAVEESVAPPMSWARCPRFENVTTLSLIATARITNHFVAAASFFPNLQDLTLTCPYYDMYHLIDRDRLECTVTFPLLRRLVVTGATDVMFHALDTLLCCFPNIETLVLHVPDDSSTDIQRAIEAISMLSNLSSLSFYGQAKFAGKDLVTFPILETIVYVDIGYRVPFDTSPLVDLDTLDAEKEPDFADFYKTSQLQKLFAAQPSLQQVYWTRQYPSDLLAITNDTTTWAAQGVICGVRRYSGNKTLSNQFVQYIPIKIGRSSGMLKARRMEVCVPGEDVEEKMGMAGEKRSGWGCRRVKSPKAS